MRYNIAWATLALLLLPASASAQLVVTEPDVRVPRIRITAHIGYLVPFTRSELWGHPEGGDTRYDQVTTSVPSGVALGAHGEVTIAGPVGLSIAAAAATRGGTRFRVEGDEPRLLDASTVVLGRAGLSFQLPNETADLVNRRVRIALFAGGAMLHERPGDAFGIGNLLQSATHYGAAFGAIAERAFSNDRFALQVGVEDYLISWNEAALARLPAVYYSEAGTTATTGSSHLWLLRAGITIRF
jgi:hypothetical protein